MLDAKIVDWGSHMVDTLNGLATTGRAAGTIGAPTTSGKTVASFGSMLGAVAASSCCLMPLALFSLGAGGAWIGNLTALAPYQPIFFAITAAFLGTGFYLVYRAPQPAGCEDDASCASPGSDRLVKTVLWASTVLVAAAVAFNYLAPVLLST